MLGSSKFKGRFMSVYGGLYVNSDFEYGISNFQIP